MARISTQLIQLISWTSRESNLMPNALMRLRVSQGTGMSGAAAGTYGEDGIAAANAAEAAIGQCWLLTYNRRRLYSRSRIVALSNQMPYVKPSLAVNSPI